MCCKQTFGERLENGQLAPSPFIGRDCDIAWDRYRIAGFRDRLHTSRWAVAIDDEPAVALENKPAAKQTGHFGRHFLSADIVGDV